MLTKNNREDVLDELEKVKDLELGLIESVIQLLNDTRELRKDLVNIRKLLESGDTNEISEKSD